ncbi:hypothetical protein V1512DRAFT_291096 [Lipomyces arxii]|uniref:uncharacterized protein n=1 Tax=Lipomyces arxii TaxID=56418 RepID=UPI0034CED100
MSDREKSKLYLYSVPPPYEDSDEQGDIEPGPSSSSSATSSRDGIHSTPAERQQFLPRGLVRDDTMQIDDADSVSLSTPRSSADSSELRREMLQMEIIEPPPSAILRPSIPSRIATKIKSQFTTLSRMTSHINVFEGVSQRFEFIGRGYDAVASRYDTAHSAFWSAVNRKLESYGNPFVIKRLSIVFLLSMGMWLIIASDLVPFGRPRSRNSWPTEHYNIEALQHYFYQSVNAEQISSRLQELTALPHMAGTAGDIAMAEYMAKAFRDIGAFDEIETKEYDVFLTFPDPSAQRFALLSNGAKRDTYEVIYEALLREGEAEEGKRAQQPFPIHGFSAKGNATGHLIYANYGTKKDFATLKRLGIEVKGAIVICRYGHLHESLKIKAAEMNGAAAVAIFRDKPSKDAISFPNGTAVPEGGVQRGSAALRNVAPGDPLSQGWASLPDAQKLTKAKSPALVNIPSLPISWDDAQHFLSAMKGYGVKVDAKWEGSFTTGIEEWWSGSSKGPRANLRNVPIEQEKQPIWNIIAKIEGEDQGEKAIVLGAHRDSWCYGASDAMSGTTVLLEVARIIGEIITGHAWRPMRSIYFASWDGTEQNLVGSTEWVEENLDLLRKDGVAYINLDQAVSGSEFRVTGNPVFESTLFAILNGLHDPFRNATLGELWARKPLPALEADRDTIPFQSHAGIASLDIGFAQPGGYPMRSCFDNMEWLLLYGDPNEVEVEPGKFVQVAFRHRDLAKNGHPYVYHKLLTQIVGALLIRYSEEMNIPFDFSAYSRSLVRYMSDLTAYAGKVKLDRSHLNQASAALMTSALTIDKWNDDWMKSMMEMGHVESSSLTGHRWSRNSRMVNFDKHLLGKDGLKGRTWFKHVIYGPMMWPPTVDDGEMNSVNTFTAVRDALERGDKAAAQAELDRIAFQLKEAAEKLVS